MPTAMHVWTPGLDNVNFRRSGAASRPEALGAIPRSSSRGSSPFVSTASSWGRDTGRSFGSSIPPPDLPGSRIGEWSPFNVRNFSRSNCSLITLAREHHAAIDRLRQAEAEASASPDAVFNVLPRFQQPTQNLTLRQWPRGDIPATELLPRQRKRTTSRFVSPARGTTDYARTGSDLLLARKLPPGPYLWAGAGAPPGATRKGMVFR